MRIDDATLTKVLLAGKYVSARDIKKAEVYAAEHRSSISQYLLDEHIITKEVIGTAIADTLDLPYFDLAKNEPTKEQILSIPENVGRRYRVVFLRKEGGKTFLATDDPAQEGFDKAVQPLFPGQQLVLHFSHPDDIDAGLIHYAKSLDSQFSKILEGEDRIAPVVLEHIFVDAAIFHASDIHFEPQGTDVLVRFRIDGVLRDVARLPKKHYENVLNRIKVQSGIRIDEHFAAQDGSMRFQNDSISMDLRTSIVPTVEGEKTVLRALTSYVQALNLHDLGLSPRHQEILEEIASKPFGMIVVSGPTGAGKTTTLYSLLKLLNKPDVNITTIEDPVEYRTPGINQIQVNSVTNLTFARGLRSIVRQDPDIILVGEIRDSETAEIAVNAALTGHLLLSTFHSNDAATAIPRLLDMGIEPFLLASTLELIVAQRLVRRICEKCKRSAVVSASDLVKVNSRLAPYFSGSVTLYEGAGCEACGYSGFKGRNAIFEFVIVTPEIQNLVLKNPSAKEIAQLAYTKDNPTLFEDGIQRVKEGTTTLDELLRVAEPPDIV